MALVSSPPPRCPLQSSHQAGSAPQQHVVEVGDPLLEAGPGVGPLGPRHPFPPLTCAFRPTLLIPPGWAQQGPFLWEASWASPQKRPVSSSGILRSFTRFSVKTLVFCSVFWEPVWPRRGAAFAPPGHPRGQHCGWHTVGAQEVIRTFPRSLLYCRGPAPRSINSSEEAASGSGSPAKAPRFSQPHLGPETYSPGVVLWASARGEGAGAADGLKAPPNQDRPPRAQPPGEGQGLTEGRAPAPGTGSRTHR